MSKISFVRPTSLWSGDGAADRIVPPSGFSAGLTLFAAATMAFLAVFALAVSLASGRLANSWGDDLARGATLRIAVPEGQAASVTEAALTLLRQTEGIESARALSEAEVQALLEPWFGPDIPTNQIDLPILIDIQETASGYDAQGLRLRLQAEVPEAVLDDHARWRAPLVTAAHRLRVFGWFAMCLITVTVGAIVTLAANAALAANSRIIAVLRLVGATDSYIATAFVRRFTLRSAIGSVLGTFAGMFALMMLPSAGDTTLFLTGLGFRGWHWLLPLLIPVVTAMVGFVATNFASRRVLQQLA